MSTIKRSGLTCGVLAGTFMALALGCAVKVNGKSYGPGGGGGGGGGGGPTAASPGAAGGAAAAPDDGNPAGASSATLYGPPPTRCYTHREPPAALHPSSPVDPWIAVDKDVPAIVPGLFRSHVDDDENASCTAEHDHCLRECEWFVQDDRTNLREAPARARSGQYAGDGYFNGRGYHASTEGTTGYRTVPATRRLLTAGAILLAVDAPARVAADNTTDHPWRIGVLDRVDWKRGTIYMKGSANPFWLSTTRVAVLSYRDGGKVEIVGGRKRDELAVKANELFAPLADAVAVSDPWSQVGKDGQPLAADDRQPYMTTNVTCAAANDQCLRPWAWLVDVGNGRLRVGKFDGRAFRVGSEIDELEVLDNPGLAYRSKPATREALRVGATVFVADGDARNERNAHAYKWTAVKVTRVRPDGRFEGDGPSGGSVWSVDSARIPVLSWFPGDRAEKVE